MEPLQLAGDKKVVRELSSKKLILDFCLTWCLEGFVHISEVYLERAEN
jgi:hypothetical protein